MSTPLGSACASRLRGGWKFLRAIMGADAYEQHLRYLARNHPDEPPPSERDFWRRHLDWQDRHPQGRCC